LYEYVNNNGTWQFSLIENTEDSIAKTKLKYDMGARLFYQEPLELIIVPEQSETLFLSYNCYYDVKMMFETMKN
jgi:hypothetical protein